MKKRSLADISWTPVSHNPEIVKKVMLASGEPPGLTNFSQAVLAPGQVSPGHAHGDMHEVFFVEKGSGSIVIEGTEYALEERSCVLVEAGERHEIRNSSDQDLLLLYFGLRSRDPGRLEA